MLNNINLKTIYERYREIILLSLISTLLILCLTACNDDNKSDNDEAYKADSDYKFEDYLVSYNDINLHMDSVCKSDFGKNNIILIHGLTYSSHEFDINYKDYSLVRFLADKGYTVWRLDIAGYGKSDKPVDGFLVDSDYAADNIYYAVKEICSITGADNINVLGWSWGTVTTSRFASNHPEMVNKLVLYAPIVSGVGDSIVDTDYHENSWENAASDFQLNEAGKIDENIVEPAVVEYFCSSCWKNDGKASPNGPRKDICVDGSFELIDMAKIKAPTLLVYGDNDPYLNYELIEKMYQELPEGSDRNVISGAAHCAYIEKPFYHDFQNAIIDFLETNIK